MKLKSIQIHGFKSFADRVTINYHDGITGVIGPNGSGKSNVIDAVRWVMGEQTAKSLRADDPTDIIFAGSQSRKPLGMAEVTLTFSNDGRNCPPEFIHLPEVSITRRIYRDAEREYLLNKEPCRLKDIAQFLMSIGLGSRTYAIIQQERRDRIVQARPEDLRAILEETAGITVFKNQRKEAEKRLHSTSEQLEKLDAVESELSRQAEHLEEQVEKARQKIEYSRTLRDSEIALLADNIAFHKAIALSVRSELAAFNETSQRSTVDTAGFEAEAARLTSEKIEVSHQMQAVEDETDEKRLQLTKLSERHHNQLAMATERAQQIQNLSQQIQAEQEEQELLQERQRTSAELMETAAADSERIDGEIETLANREEDASETARTVQSRFEEMKSEARVLQNRLESGGQQAEELLETIQMLNSRALERQATLESKRTACAAQEQAIADALAEQGSEAEALSTSERRFSALNAEQTALTERRQHFNSRHEVKHRQLLEVDARLNSLNELAAQDHPTATGGGLPERLTTGTQAVQPFFEAFRLTEDAEDLLERALPEWLSAFEVRSLADLQSELSGTTLSDGPRRHFLAHEWQTPLSDEEKATHSQILQVVGVSCAARALKMGQEHPLRHLFERVFFCPDIRLATRCRNMSTAARGFLFLLPNGALLLGHGELRVGRSQDVRTEGVLKRRREAEVLSQQRNLVYTELTALENELQTLDEKLDALKEEADLLRKDLSRQKEEAIRKEATVASLRLQHTHSAESARSLEAECAELLASRLERQERYESVKSRLDADAAALAELEARQDDSAEATHTCQEQLSEIRHLLAERRAEKQVLSERAANARRQFEEWGLQAERSRTKTDRLIAERNTLAVQAQGTAESTADLDAEIERLHEETALGEARIADFQTRLLEFEERLHVLQSRISAERNSLVQRERQIAEKQMALARAEAILETQYKDAWERFALSESDFTQTEPPEQDNRSALEAKIQKLKKRLDELGPINEAAMSEFEETREKLAFLRSQRSDIQASIDGLAASIAEVEERTKTTFLETYTAVGKEFENLFPILFPGGEARLNLLDPNNLLETGVEILVRLPGKRMQNMSLFSGGEKALTAISLIFALLKTSPAPFCYLDEVDAPLDEANVGRFNSVLEALSGEFQFVVITHNRRTMEVLDTIYGISMNEPGVSRLVSVDLSEVPERMQKKSKGTSASPPHTRAGAVSTPAPVG
jgi:chromosome segregation protein